MKSRYSSQTERPSKEKTLTTALGYEKEISRLKKEKIAAELQFRSDQGFQYTSHAYFKLTKEYGITPSMSRRGNSYDNSLDENFFRILKAEGIYRHTPRTLAEVDELINRYIYFYNHERIQQKNRSGAA